jgi:hypothetical protein
MMAWTNREMPVHLAVLGYLRTVLPPHAIIHHAANELGLSGPAAARAVAKAKHLGMMPGWPDLEVFVCGHPPMFFEVKADGGRLTDAQKEVADRLTGAGCNVAVVRGIADVRAALAAWDVKTREAA